MENTFRRVAPKSRLKFLLYFIFLASLAHNAGAQNGYNILYKATSEDYIIAKYELFTRVVYNNFLAYSYSFPQGKKDPMEDRQDYGKRYVPQSIIIKRSSADRFLYYGLKGYKFYWVLDTSSVKVPEWKFTSETKEILGHQCKKAYWLNEFLLPSRDSSKTWRVDSVIVWYAADIKADYIIWNYAGLPGLPLEIIDGIRKWRYKAIWLKRENIFIEEPKNILPMEKLKKH